MKWIITFLISFPLVGSICQQVELREKAERKAQFLESLLEKCLKKEGHWNLQGYYFLCEATYMGVSDYHIYLGENKHD